MVTWLPLGYYHRAPKNRLVNVNTDPAAFSVYVGKIIHSKCLSPQNKYLNNNKNKNFTFLFLHRCINGSAGLTLTQDKIIY